MVDVTITPEPISLVGYITYLNTSIGFSIVVNPVTSTSTIPPVSISIGVAAIINIGSTIEASYIVRSFSIIAFTNPLERSSTTISINNRESTNLDLLQRLPITSTNRTEYNSSISDYVKLNTLDLFNNEQKKLYVNNIVSSSSANNRVIISSLANRYPGRSAQQPSRERAKGLTKL